MNFIKKNIKGIALCFVFSIIAYFLGKRIPLIGGAVFGIIFGMIVGSLIKDKKPFENGIKFTSKKILQYAVILLGFGMNLKVIMKTGMESLPIILSTITTSLVVGYIIYKSFNISSKISTLISVGSSICGGSAIAATAPIIDANDEEIAQAISVVFLFNILAVAIFPILGNILGFPTTNGEIFGIFAGTAVNDTSSVTAVASMWDSMYNLGSQTLDKAVTVKLTRTLAIIPITICLSFIKAKNNKNADKHNISKSFPYFIIYFILASVITTFAINIGVSSGIFAVFKTISKFFIVMAMFAIGFNTNIIKLIKNGAKPILLGLICWICITIVTVIMMNITNIL